MKNVKETKIDEIKESNLEEIKEVSICLLNVDIKFLNFIICSHPYTNSSISMDKNGDLLNLSNEKDLNIWRNNMKKLINKSKDIIGIYKLLNKSYLLTWLKFNKDYLSDKDFAELLQDAWIRSENPNCDVNVSINELIKWFKNCDKKALMGSYYNFYENEIINKNKSSNENDNIILYRGVSSGRKELGMSWTADFENAKWFANRFGNGYVIKVEANRKDVLAYLNQRGEDEYVLDVNKYKNKFSILENKDNR